MNYNEMSANEIRQSIILTVTFSIIFVCMYFFVFLSYSCHLFPNAFTKKYSFCPYWIDYGILLLYLILFIFIYLFYLAINLKPLKIPQCIKNAACVRINLLLCSVYVIFGCNLLINSLSTFRVSRTIIRMVKVKAKDINNLTKILRQINPTMVTPMKTHLYELIIVWIIILTYMTLHVLSIDRYKKCKDEDEKNKWRRIFKIISKDVLIAIHFLYLLVEFISIFLLHYFKRLLLENNFYAKDLEMQAKYNLNVAQVVFFNDFITNKIIIDFIGILPCLLFFMQGKTTVISLIVMFLIYLIYFIFNGVLYAYIDQKRKVPVNKCFKRLICYNAFTLNFGEKEKAKLFDEYLLDFTADENNNFYNDNDSENNELYPLFEKEDEEEDNNELMTEYTPANFYLIFKMIYLFYFKNQDKFSMIYQYFTDPNKKTEYVNLLKSIENNFIFKQDEIVNKEEDNLFYEDIKKLNINNMLDFEVSLVDPTDFKSLFPYYKINFTKIMNSLNPKDNINLPNIFNKMKNAEKSSNSFYTFDRHLLIEIYDTHAMNDENNSNLISIEKIEDFIKAYKTFYLELIKNKRFSFIPIIVGIFNIKYDKYNKFIVLYKNPISFIDYVNTEYSSIISLSETDIKYNKINLGGKEKSLEELKEDLTLTKDRIESINNTLERDFHFIKEINFVSFFKVNLCACLIDDKKENSSNDSKKSSIQEIITTIRSDNKDINFDLTVIENIENVSNKDNRYALKIFISELFRQNIDSSMRDILKTKSNITYFNFIKQQLNRLLCDSLNSSVEYIKDQTSFSKCNVSENPYSKSEKS